MLPMRKRRRTASKRASRALQKKPNSKFGFAVYQGGSTFNKVPRPLFGNSYTTKLVYFERGFSLNPGAGGLVAEHVFSANGCYDPDISGVGHQPTGFDQLMTFFDHYTVHSSSISVRFNNSDATYDQFCGVYLADGADVQTDMRVIIENGKGVYAELAPDGTTPSRTQLDTKGSTAKFLGRPDVLDEDDLRGSNASNPDEQLYWHIWAAPGSSVDSAAVGFAVRLEYWVTFTEPRDVPLS